MKPVDYIFLIGIVAAGLIGLIVIAGAIFWKDASKEVMQWGGTIIGFFFGTFFSLLKDYMRMGQEPRNEPKAPNAT